MSSLNFSCFWTMFSRLRSSAHIRDWIALVVPSFALASRRAFEGVGLHTGGMAGCWRLVLEEMRSHYLRDVWSIISKSGNRAPSGVSVFASGRGGVVNDSLLLRRHLSLKEAF